MIKLVTFLFCIGLVNSTDITTDVFGQYTEFLPAAFGDFNADRLTDMFVIQKLPNGATEIKILLSNDVPPYFSPSNISCIFHKNHKVKSVVPSDFDGDGAMDLMVIVLKENIYHAHILWGNLKSLECLEEHVSMALFSSQPLLMDLNGDMIADLFGDDEHGNRSFWQFSTKRLKPVKIKMIDSSDEPLPNLRLTGGHAFVDLDDDLAADLWIDAKGRFEFWSSSENYARYKVIDHPRKDEEKFEIIGQSSFLDIDLDGSTEVLLPVCADENCGKSFLYVYDFSNSSKKWLDLKVNFKDENEVVWSFPSKYDISYNYANTITPRIGDINLDGYPDILMTVFSHSNPKVILLINTECKVDCNYPRTFVPKWKTFDTWSSAVMGTFFDFEDDGTLDVLLVNATSKSGESKPTYNVGAYKDDIEYDAMFLKVLVLTGVCYQNCPHGNIPYGTNQPGPSISYSMTSTSGSEQRACATQLTQSSHYSLQLPFTILGLGRNWNFVDRLRIGLPIRENLNNSSSEDEENLVLRSEFTQIIPNSQLKVIPYPINEPDQWITKLFITPSKALLMTAGSLVATCLFVAAIIGVLHYREKQEDKRERRQEAQKFHFDAM